MYALDQYSMIANNLIEWKEKKEKEKGTPSAEFLILSDMVRIKIQSDTWYLF